jgi:hypothetical protein
MILAPLNSSTLAPKKNPEEDVLPDLPGFERAWCIESIFPLDVTYTTGGPVIF